MKFIAYLIAFFALIATVLSYEEPATDTKKKPIQRQKSIKIENPEKRRYEEPATDTKKKPIQRQKSIKNENPEKKDARREAESPKNKNQHKKIEPKKSVSSKNYY